MAADPPAVESPPTTPASASATVPPGGAAEPQPRPWLALQLLVPITGLHVGWGLVQGTLVPTAQGVLLGPAMITLVLVLVIGAGRAAAAGRPRSLVVATLLLALCSYPILGGGIARFMLYPGNSRALPDRLDGGAEVVAYGEGFAPPSSAGAERLRGVLVRGRGPAPRPVLVFFHGNAQAAASCVGLAREFAALDVDVFVAEYRGFGGCAGSPTEEGLLEDGRAALRAAERLTGVPSREHVLTGLSLGTGVAAAMAAEGHGRAVVLFAPYTSITDIGARIVPPWLARLAIRDSFDSRARLAGATQPVTILHGTADRIIPFALGKALADSLGPRGRLVELPGVDHNDVFDDMRPVLAALGAAARPERQ